MYVLIIMAITIFAARNCFAYHGTKAVALFYRFSSSKLQMTKKLDIRPTLDDIERISKGQAAKRRGTGSRAVPHRLNTLERKEWDLAKKRRFLMLRGTGWRKERGDSPLANIYRNYCDAVAVPCINLMRSIGVSQSDDQVLIDFSPLRTVNVAEMASDCIATAKMFTSFQNAFDYSNPIEMGWGDISVMLETEVIWRIPVYSVVLSFSVRSDARRYAAIVATKYADGDNDNKELANELESDIYENSDD